MSGLLLNDDDFYGITPGYNLPSIDEVEDDITPDKIDTPIDLKQKETKTIDIKRVVDMDLQ